MAENQQTWLPGVHSSVGGTARNHFPAVFIINQRNFHYRQGNSEAKLHYENQYSVLIGHNLPL